MRYTVLLVDVTRSYKAQTPVKVLQMGLGADLDGLPSVPGIQLGNRDLHQGSAESAAAHCRRGYYPPDTGVIRIRDASLQNAGVGHYPTFQRPDQVDGLLVLTVGIQVPALLFDHKDLLS